ncbi:MAG: sugar phosphate isomerase/epimerase [Planctomycetes bacterium]|nr:sugar phosphate isomerase/epimerase [Planctomycetota bacterium]
MTKISFHSGGFVDRPLAWTIEHLASLGYDGIEIVTGPKAHIKNTASAGELEEVRGLLQQHGLAPAAINPYTAPNISIMAKEKQAREFYGQLIDIAAAVGAPTVNFLPGTLPEGDTETWKILVLALKEIAPHAEARGIFLSCHNHEGMLIDTPEKVLLLRDHVGSPQIKALCDITNFYILRYPVEDAVRVLSPHIVHAHVKGVKGMYPYNQFLIPGEPGDELPFPRFARALESIGYDRFVSVEVFSWMSADKARIAVEMMRQSVPKAK